MRADQQTEYIVQCIRDAGSMYEDDARQFLAEHDAHVRAEALAEARTPASGPTGRVAVLLDAIRTHRGEWTTRRVQQLYRDSPLPITQAPDGRLRAVARGDLRDLAAWGHLLLNEAAGRRFYTLATRKDRT